MRTVMERTGILRLIFLLSVLVAAWSQVIEDQWILRKSGNAGFNHMVLDRQTGKLYMSAKGTLFVFNDSLQSPYEVQIGPKKDNLDCPPMGADGLRKCKQPEELLPVFTKALVIDYQNKQLIVCTNLFHGTCQKRYLENILYPDEIPARYVPVVGNDARVSTVMFIAPGPLTDDSGNQLNALYVGAQRSISGPSLFNDLIPSFASRQLANFHLTNDDISAKSKIVIEAKYSESFPVYYKYGFSSQGFSYTIAVQKEAPDVDSYITKIARVCQKDAQFTSYAEVQLECVHDGDLYNLAQAAAHVEKIGAGFSKTSNISEKEEMLYVAFSKSVSDSVEPASETALCVYPMREVVRKFTENIQACFEGHGHTGPEYITMPNKCVDAKNTFKPITDDYCGEHDVNYPIDGVSPITTAAAAVLDSVATAITVSHEDHFDVVFVGKVDGRVAKVIVTSPEQAVVYDEVPLDPGVKINADMFMDTKGTNLYVLTDFKVQKLKVDQWRKHKNHDECKDVKNDPYCDTYPNPQPSDAPPRRPVSALVFVSILLLGYQILS